VTAAIRRFRVFPLYHQVEIRDATDDVDYPRWETGEERVLASAQCVVLATRSDLEGEVDIEVCFDTDMEDRAAGELVFQGELLTTGQGILVGDLGPAVAREVAAHAGAEVLGLADVQHPPGGVAEQVYAGQRGSRSAGGSS
jgi:hypothetical protein